jgi:hypothetical protein
MGEVISLRKARKANKKRDEVARAAANRVLHGQSKAERTLGTARKEDQRRKLDAHKLDSGDA